MSRQHAGWQADARRAFTVYTVFCILYFLGADLSAKLYCCNYDNETLIIKTRAHNKGVTQRNAMHGRKMSKRQNMARVASKSPTISQPTTRRLAINCKKSFRCTLYSVYFTSLAQICLLNCIAVITTMKS